jgi:hypothetical protein
MGERGPSGHPRAVGEDCEIRSLLGQIEGVVYRGHEGVRRWFTDVYSHWTEFCPELRAFGEAEDSLLVTGRIRARGRVSGVELDTAIWRHRFPTRKPEIAQSRRSLRALS